MEKVRLKTLSRGQWFKMDEHQGYLLYANECRARVKVDGKPVFINGEFAFFSGCEVDWGPDTMVIPTEKFEDLVVDLSHLADEEVDLSSMEEDEVDLTSFVNNGD